MDHSKYKNYKRNFPKTLLNELNVSYPNLFNMQTLENELTVIYGDERKQKPALELLNYIYNNELTDV